MQTNSSKNANNGFFQSVYKVVAKIPKGKVASYGMIARALGSPRAARQVGWALHVNPYFGEVPCHRVVNRNGFLSGSFAFGGINVQRDMLINEGVEVDEQNNVDMQKFCCSIEELI